MRKRLMSLFKPIRSVWRYGVRPVIRQIGKWAGILFLGLIRWFAKLNPRLLLQGLPALVVGGAALMLLAISMTARSGDLEGRYLEEAHSAKVGKRYKDALVCYERLANLKNDRDDVLYELALTAEAAGEMERCGQIMRELAPPDRRGYAKAHFWVADRLRTRPNSTAQGMALVESHLQKALEGDDVDRAAIHGFLGQICLVKGLLLQAEDHLQIAVKTHGQFHLALMETYRVQGERYAGGGNADASLAQTKFDLARKEAQRAADFHGAAARANREDHLARYLWAKATARLDAFPEALAILDEGFKATGNPSFRLAQAEVYAFWFDKLGRKQPGITAERLLLLEFGLRLNPDNLVLLDGLLEFSSLERDSVTRQRLGVAAVGVGTKADPLGVLTLLTGGMSVESARTKLLDLLTHGKISSQVHFTLGVDAWQRGLTKEARFHWEEALKLSPNIPRVANNLAWLLYKNYPKELDRALVLSNLAVEKGPQDARFNETRGKILLKLGKFPDALTDLNKALVRSPDNPELHSLLADVYGQLEMPEIAVRHRALAQEKENNKTLKH